MNLLIADDHLLVAQALSNVLKNSGDYQVDYAPSLQICLQKIAMQEFEFILLDIRMPGMTGLQSVIDVVKKSPKSAVVLFSGDADEHFVKACVAAGARGYIPKSMDVNAVHVALQLIALGQNYIPFDRSISNDKDTKSPASGLTDRELVVIKFAAQGETNKEIARRLATNETLIKMQMRNICAKLFARNRAHACMIARERLII